MLSKEALQNNTLYGKDGRWVELNGVRVFVDPQNKVVAPAALRGQNFDEVDVNSLPELNVNPQKMQIVTALIAANTAGYKRLQEYLDNLANAIALGGEFKAEQEQYDRFITFLRSYSPIEPKMRDFLKKYEMNNQQLIEQLGALIQQDSATVKPTVEKSPVVKKNVNPVNVRKFGLYRFPFMQQEKLYFGNVEDYDFIPQDWDFTGTHFKKWVNIKGIPFLVNGYRDDEYSAVNRVLSAQVGKMLGLNCEEVFLGHLHGKCVTLTAFHEAITLLEQQMFQKFGFDELNYLYQYNQKRAFYFLIQHWVAYAFDGNKAKERFNYHFIDSEGSIFCAKHEQAMFLTPQQMARNLMVRLDINATNYRAIKDMVIRVGARDIADIVFSSIPEEFIELHDTIANKLNKHTFQQKKEAFDGNWAMLLEALAEFEQMQMAPQIGRM